MEKLYDVETNLEILENCEALGLVSKHQSAMTKEQLHSKAFISVELAIRDLRISQLKNEILTGYTTLHGTLQRDLLDQQERILQAVGAIDLAISAISKDQKWAIGMVAAIKDKLLNPTSKARLHELVARSITPEQLAKDVVLRSK